MLTKIPLRREMPSNILEAYVKEIEARGGMICGGFARYMVMNPNESESTEIAFSDIDVWPTSVQSSTELVKLFSQFMSNKTRYTHEYMAVPTDIVEAYVGNIKFQLVDNIHQKPEEVLNRFDLSASQVCLNYIGGYGLVTDEFIKGQTSKILILNPDVFEIITECERGFQLHWLARLEKYIHRGYKLDINILSALVSLKAFVLREFERRFEKYSVLSEEDRGHLDFLFKMRDLELKLE